MRKRVWHKGPPPQVGWWNANTLRDSTIWRWWNGKEWSYPVAEHSTMDFVVHAAMHSYKAGTDHIEWTTYYPKNARVPRIKP